MTSNNNTQRESVMRSLIGLKIRLESKGVKIHLPLKDMVRWKYPMMMAFLQGLRNKHSKSLR